MQNPTHNSFFYSSSNPNLQIASRQSSEEICTLYPPTPPSGGGGGRGPGLSMCNSPGNPGSLNGNPIPNIITNAPIGVFWDIENCQVPRGKSGLVAVKQIREKFFGNYTEAEFVCVCDIRKESPQIIQELNDAQVSVIHVSGNSKNAADDKLRQAMRRFADTYSSATTSFAGAGGSHSHCSLPIQPQPQPAIILISGDINFASDLSDLRHRKRLYVILLHNKHAPEALILCAHEHYDFHSLLYNLPDRYSGPGGAYSKECLDQKKGKGSMPLKGGHCPMDVVVTDLPQTKNLAKLKNRLKKLCDNTGGKVVSIQGQFACLRFPNKEAALRASKRMNGEDVFGSKIRVLYSSQMEFTTASNPSQLHESQNSSSTRNILGPNNQIPSHPQYTQKNGPWLQVQHQHSPQNSTWERETPAATGVTVSASEYHNHPGINNKNTIGSIHEQLDHQLGTDSSNSHSGKSRQSTSSSRDSSRDPSPALIATAPPAQTFDLHVTNIDPNLGDWKSVRSALVSIFSEFVIVRGVWVYTGGQDSMTAIVRVDSKEDARTAVAQLHRRKIGNKRISISFNSGPTVEITTLKKEVASILLEVPTQSLPFLKFREIFEKRYQRSISSSDLYKMKDVVMILDNNSANLSNSSSGSSGSGNSSLFTNTGRTIMLSKDWKITGNGIDVYCSQHPPTADRFGSSTGSGSNMRGRVGWAEKEAGPNLPNVIIELGVLTQRIFSLLENHNGSFPLLSFMDCYESEFGSLSKVEDGEQGGVPLEHLIASVQGVEIAFGDNGMKRVQWHEKKDFNFGSQNTLAMQLSQLARELVDLLKTFPRCSILFSKLIPAYHHHFGKQCRVADYGHTSLLTLLQTLPNTIQVIGEGHQRIITLAHRAHMKRFTTDVLRVLKAQPGLRKQILLTEFQNGFSQVFPARFFTPEDYGLCFLNDLIQELVENSNLVSLSQDEKGNSVLIIPKREQTTQEAHRTRIFAAEVTELLAHSIRCELPFSKFIPSYHHHYGRQCRVSDYGFSKLAELFEAINDTVHIVCPTVSGLDCNPEDKIIRLSPKEQLKVVGEQIWNLVKKRKDLNLPTYVDELEELFLVENGFSLSCINLSKSRDDEEDVISLIRDKLSQYVYLDEDNQILPLDRFKIDELARETRTLLETQPSCSMDETQFMTFLNKKYQNTPIDISAIEKELAHMIIVSENEETKCKQISLAPLRVFAREITELLEEFGGYLPILNIENAYMQKFGRQLRPQQLGYPSLLILLQAIPEVATLRGKSRTKRILVLNNKSNSGNGGGGSWSANGNKNYTDQRTNGYHYNHNNYNGVSRYEHRPRPNPLSAQYPCNSSAQIQNYPQLAHGGNTGGYEQPQWNPHAQQIQPLMIPASPVAFQQHQTHNGPGDSNIFNFEQPTALSTPVYDMWMTTENQVQVGSSGGNGCTPPISPTAVVWAYHPVCYPSPTTPGSPNVLIPSFSFSPWSPPPQQISNHHMGNCYSAGADSQQL